MAGCNSLELGFTLVFLGALQRIFRVPFLSLILTFGAQGALAQDGVFDLPYGQNVTRDELKYYLKERLVPEAIESAVAKPDALKNAIVNLYVMKRASSIAESEALVSPGELEYRRGDGGRRLGLQAFVTDRSNEVLGSTDWTALADERYLAEQAKLGERVQVNVDHILVKADGRTFLELIARVAEVQAEIERGVPFRDLVAKYSEDTSASRNGGSLGFISRGRTDPAFEEVAFAMTEIDAISEPVLSSFGVHLIKYNGRRTRAATPQASVQKSLIKQVKRERSEAVRGEVLAQFRGEAWPYIEDLDEAALGTQILAELREEFPDLKK